MIVGGEDHKTGHSENTNACFLNLEAYVMKYIRPPAIQYQWSSQYFEPADGLPYIGHLPGHNENILVATGYGGNGMVYSAVAAMLLSSMILQKDTPYLSLFDPNRIKPIAGFKSFISHNADVVKQFIGKWFRMMKWKPFPVWRTTRAA
jgi:glycine/D-amino acid oxidase-like deaminating enzyme